MSAEHSSDDAADGVDAEAATDDAGGEERVYRCLDCKAPIPDVVIASRCEACGAALGDDRFLIEAVTPALLRGVRAERDGCINCGASTGSVFCSTGCNEDWFATYTDAYLR